MNTSMGMNKARVMMKKMDIDKKTALLALGALGGVTAIGMTAAAVYNSKQMRTARAVKRTGKILYQVGTAMRNVSGVAQM